VDFAIADRTRKRRRKRILLAAAGTAALLAALLLYRPGPAVPEALAS